MLSVKASATDVRTVLRGHAGCFLVDYSFTETESLKPGYERDKRVYDTNNDKTTYEWIYAADKSPTEIRLQHILFTKDLATGAVQGMLKHQAEDWQENPTQVYDYVRSGEWTARQLNGAGQGKWVRKVTNLDDGLRYQCEATFDVTAQNPVWTCSNFAPIPGRETRDMQRRDYNSLERTTKIVSYGPSWLEKQENVKVILDETTLAKVPLAREHGRTWYIRQPDAQCADAQALVTARRSYWEIVMNAWEGFLATPQTWKETRSIGGVSRYAAMSDIEDRYWQSVPNNPARHAAALAEINSTINQYRLP